MFGGKYLSNETYNHSENPMYGIGLTLSYSF